MSAREQLVEHTTRGGVPHLRFADMEVPKLGPVVEEDIPHFAKILGEDEARQRLAASLARQAAFAGRFHLDDTTARTLLRVVKAIGWNQRLVLEGPAGTGKTSLIAWGANLLGAEVERVNFHLTTDAGDVLARYAPNPSGIGFVIQEGPIARAARFGRVVLLDEPNLAPASVLDALLAVTERGATELAIHEVGLCIPLHHNTRFLAAINPVESHHQGRRPMSRPLRSRMQPYIVPEPTPAEVGGSIRKLTRGIVPRVSVHAAPWIVPPVPPLYPLIGKLVGFGLERCDMLGRFVQDLAERTRERVIGSNRREAYVVDRRRVDQFLSDLERALTYREPGDPVGELWNAAFEDAFLNGFEPGIDRDTVEEQALALALYPLVATDLHVSSGARPTTAGPRSIFSQLRVGHTVRYGGRRFRVDRVDSKGAKVSDKKTSFTIPRRQLYGKRADDGDWAIF